MYIYSQVDTIAMHALAICTSFNNDLASYHIDKENTVTA